MEMSLALPKRSVYGMMMAAVVHYVDPVGESRWKRTPDASLGYFRPLYLHLALCPAWCLQLLLLQVQKSAVWHRDRTETRQLAATVKALSFSSDQEGVSVILLLQFVRLVESLCHDLFRSFRPLDHPDSDVFPRLGS